MIENATASTLQGYIDTIQGDTVYGWIYAHGTQVEPLLFMDGKPAKLVGVGLERPDVAKALGIQSDTGFIFRVSHVSSKSILSLYGVCADFVSLITSRSLGIPVFENRFLMQLQEAARISQQKDAVAIVCWDGSHNTLSRAKVLYDIVTHRRPAVLFCYAGYGLGENVWLPLVSSDLPVVTVPWLYRRYFRTIARDYGVHFDTVWICNPRLPSFFLAADISHSGSRYICDIDEENMQTEQGSGAASDTPGLGLAQLFLKSVPSRTVVSPTLKQRFGGLLVRNVCRPFEAEKKREISEQKKIAFIGTVGEHTNILEIAQVLRALHIEFYVFGDINSDLCQELLSLGVHVDSNVFSQMDAVITVSAISDALAFGIPVLIPKTPSVSDLASISGVYLFTRANFAKQVKKALQHTKPIVLPHDWTPEGAYTAFVQAEEKAVPNPLLHALLPERYSTVSNTPALILLWKQLDASYYGRRVDQIARSYKRAFPEHKVFVLEFLSAGREKANVLNYCDESALQSDFLGKKLQGYEQDGIVYRVFSYAGADDLHENVLRFFFENRLTPANSVLVVFPILDPWRELAEYCTAFPMLVDIVDNQIPWATSDERRIYLLSQYFSLMRTSSHVVLNAQSNKQFFESTRFFGKNTDVHIIPNWYTMPNGYHCKKCSLKDGNIHVWYSGNMNDRLDWDLLHKIGMMKNVRLHLAGTANRRMDALENLLSLPTVVYHGVTTERETLDLLRYMDVALVPHVMDSISRFMDPMKIAMYRAFGIPTLCPAFLNSPSKGLILYENHRMCMELIPSLAAQSTEVKEIPSENEKAYLTLLQDIRKNR